VQEDLKITFSFWDSVAFAGENLLPNKYKT
jgi:hypothetical protein